MRDNYINNESTSLSVLIYFTERSKLLWETVQDYLRFIIAEMLDQISSNSMQPDLLQGQQFVVLMFSSPCVRIRFLTFAN